MPIEPPPHLNEQARAAFQDLAAKLEPAGLARPEYAYMLGLAADRLADMQRCARMIAENGPVVGDPPHLHPALAQWQEASDHLVQLLLTEFNLDWPADHDEEEEDG